MEAAPAIGPGREVGPFKVIRLLGKGGMGMVWLARDQRLGRRVALKVIDPARLIAAGARERFRREAAATALLAHPNIVNLFEVGEEDGAPWVALEYIDGATLRSRLHDDPPPVREAIGIGHAIAGALAAAHHAGILHRDLKPSNIILGKDGRPRVVDFGLARRVGERTAEFQRRAPTEADEDSDASTLLGPIGDSAAVGTPRYMAPEQWRREEPTPGGDVWALGLVLHEMVYGRHPYDPLDRRSLREAVVSDDPVPPPDDSRPVPPALAETIAQCLDKHAERRPSAETVEAVLARLLERSTANADEADSPFRGLQAFNERHADAFFGRDAEIAAFLERLRDEPILPIVGPSGAGKSSFVQAGVLPRLRERGWSVLHVRPGRQPMVALAQRLLVGELSMPSPLSAIAETGTTQTATGVGARAPTKERPDTESDDLAMRLASEPGRLGVELRALADHGHTRVVLFVDQLEELYAGVAEDERRAFLRALADAADDPADPVRVVFTLRDDFLGRVAEVDEVRAALSRVTVLRIPGAEALRDILLRPAERAGYRWDDGLIDEMVAEVAANPAGLPLLAFTARQLWLRRDRDRRRLTRAAYNEIGGVAGALATHADGVIAGLPDRDARVVRELLLRLVSAEGTRRVVARGDLCSALPASAHELVQRLIEARLVTAHRALTAGGDAEIELAHESLIASWAQLARWIDEGKDDRAYLEHAARTAAHWEERGHRPDDLWQGEALADARRILARQGDGVPAPVAALLAASERASTRARRRRRGLALAGVLALVAIAASAWIAAFRIRDEQRATTRRFAEAQREAARAALTGGDLLAARARLRSSLEAVDSLSARALWMRLAEEPLQWSHREGAAIYGVTLSPDGETVAVAGQEGVVRLIDRVTLDSRVLGHGGDQLFSIGWSEDGTLLAAGAWDGEIDIWDVRTGERRVIRGHTADVHAVVFHGDTMYSAGEDGTLRSWNPATGAALAVWRADGSAIVDLALAGDGTLVSASWDGGVRRWDRDGHATLLGRHATSATAVAVLGDAVVSGARDGGVMVWSAGAPRELGHVDAQVAHIAIDGERVAVASSSGRIEIWAPSGGNALESLPGGDGEVYTLSLRGDLLISGGNDRTVRAWDLGTRPRRPDPGHTMTVVGVDISADGKTAISAGYDREARIWDVATGAVTGVLRGHLSRVYSAKLLPGGGAVTASGDGTVRLWDGTGGVAVAPLAMAGGRFYDISVSRDGALIAAGASDGKVHLWRPSTNQVSAFVVNTGTVDGVSVSADGAHVVTGGSDGIVRVFDAVTGARLAELHGHTNTVPGVAFSPDGTQVASCGEDGMLWLWDWRAGTGRILWRGARSYRVEYLPDGRHIGVASADGFARILDLAGTEPPRLLAGHIGEVNEVRFSADGTLAVTGGNDATVRVWDVATGQPRWRATRTGPPFTEDLSGLNLAELPASPPVAGADGPVDTVALGFDSGMVGLWQRGTGELLYQLRLHGPVSAISIDGTTLSADSVLGDHADVDLAPLEQPYCDLVRTVWAAVPVVWEGLRPVRAGPPRDHRCTP